MKVTEKIQQAEKDNRVWWSFEYFPPRTAQVRSDSVCARDAQLMFHRDYKTCLTVLSACAVSDQSSLTLHGKPKILPDGYFGLP